ncbi:MAG: hypothetical protein NZ108_04545, partial [Bacteroidia bacterium]|nr:hypothetical protein [Bacteroidia bacterium]
AGNYWQILWGIEQAILWFIVQMLMLPLLTNCNSDPLIRKLFWILLGFQPWLIASITAPTYLPVIILVLEVSVYYFLFRPASFKIIFLLLALFYSHASFQILLLVWILRIGKILNWKQIILFYSLIGLGITPLIIRNYYWNCQLLPLYTGAGIQFWIGEGQYSNQPELVFQVFQQQTGQELLTKHYGTVHFADDALLLKFAMQAMLDNPTYFLTRWVVSWFKFWIPTQGVKFWLALLINFPLLLLCAWFAIKKHNFETWLWFLVPILHSVVVSFFAVQGSYCLFWYPWLLVGLLCWLNQTKKS